MRHCGHNQFQRPMRGAAWLLALLCLWMGTGGVLHHTDDLAYAASLAAPTALGHVTPAAPADECAACEWTQGLQTGAPAASQVLLPLDSLTACVHPLSPRLLACPTPHRSPRAPPLFLS